MVDTPKSVPRRIANGRGNMNAIPRICVLFLAAVLLLDSPAAMAQGGGVYTVSGVVVDETASSASAAREKAISAAHAAAFERLIQRLVPPGQRGFVPKLSSGEVAPFVLSFGIDDEKTSDVRYIGRMTFRFHQAAVRRFLQGRGIGFAETRSKPVLLLAVFDDGSGPRLWQEPNPWFDAWKATPPTDGLVPLRLPAGDLADVRDISAGQALNGETAAIGAIAGRYGAGTVIVSEARLGVGSVGQRAINITSRYFGGASDGQTQIRSVEMQPDETLEAAVHRAALDIQRQIEEGWQRGNQLDFERLNELVAVVRLADLREWVEIRRQLRSTAFLKGLQLIAANRREVAVRLSYYGPAAQLRVALAQRDLVLEQAAGSWLLKSSRAAARIGDSPDRRTDP